MKSQLHSSGWDITSGWTQIHKKSYPAFLLATTQYRKESSSSKPPHEVLHEGKKQTQSPRTDAITLALASRAASASAAIALCSCMGNFTSLISTRSTLMPQLSVASSSVAYVKQDSELQPYIWLQASIQIWRKTIKPTNYHRISALPI